MKTVLVAINARFEHEGLAVWYLLKACRDKGIPAKVLRFSINDSMQRIWASIMEEQPDVVAFSCYIWNRELVQKLISDLKKARPGCRIIVGGPEVSYDGAEEELRKYGADYVVRGEGKSKLPALLEAIERNNGSFFPADEDDACTGTDYISPFSQEYLDLIKDRIAYIESSRGCPYRCSYCMSSLSRKFILYPPQAIEADISKLTDAGAKVIKFVDRSFNVNEKHALAIWEIVRKFSDKNVTFHFEINADILSETQIECLLDMPAGLVQIEAGIQSVNGRTLREISRVMDVDKAIDNLKRIMKKGNIHVHTDLIAGLPYEDLGSFRESFNRVYEIKAHPLQLGFLKLLHGTRIRAEADRHGYRFRDYPPYEVISNRYISADEILMLKGIEEVLDRAWNSGRLRLTLDYFAGFFPSPFDMYSNLAEFLRQKGRLYQPVSAPNLFQALKEFSESVRGIDKLTLDSCLALDYACSMKNPVIPDFLGDSEVRALDGKEALESIGREWRKEYRKTILALSGKFPVENASCMFRCLTESPVTGNNADSAVTGKNNEAGPGTEDVKLGKSENRILPGGVGEVSRVIVDTTDIDPVTGRAVPTAIISSDCEKTDF